VGFAGRQRPRQRQLRMCATVPVDDELQLLVHVVDVGDDFLDERANQTFFQSVVAARVVPDFAKALAESEDGLSFGGGEGVSFGWCRRDRAGEFCDFGELLVPALLERCGHEPVVRVALIVLRAGALGFVLGLLELTFQRPCLLSAVGVDFIEGDEACTDALRGQQRAYLSADEPIDALAAVPGLHSCIVAAMTSPKTYRWCQVSAFGLRPI
jgi:hypothetical protein